MGALTSAIFLKFQHFFLFVHSFCIKLQIKGAMSSRHSVNGSQGKEGNTGTFFPICLNFLPLAKLAIFGNFCFFLNFGGNEF